MFGNDLLIKKYPYISFSQNLIEYFEIIGYQESMIPQILDCHRKKENPIPPTIISSIISKSDYLKIVNDSIISQIYIENPYPLLIDKNELSQEPPPKSNVINHYCFSSENGKKNIIYSVFAFKFYEKYRYYIDSKDFKEYYIPKAFCIISQYSFFTLFDYICKNLYIIMRNQLFNSLPLELIIYNIVNYIPSPLNYGLHLNFFEKILDVPDYKINQLSGYNYLDFDLSQIFNLLPLNLVLEIFIFTFIEKKIVFFSKNLEILNMTMFIMYALNYPCNDGRYFSYIVSFPPKKLTEDNKLLGEIYNYMVGVNDSYNDDIDTSEIGPLYLIVDIDNKKIMLNQKKEERDLDGNDLSDLMIFIENLIKEKDKNIEKSFLKLFILRIKKKLNLFLTENIIDFNSNSKNKYVNFFNTSEYITKINKGIQEIFYDFCLNIMALFYHDYSLNSSFEKIEKINKNQTEKIDKYLYNMENLDDVEQIQNIKEECLFFKYFRQSIKYTIYFENFIQNQESLEMYKVALLCSDELINIKILDLNNDKIWNEVSLFEIIDSIYYPNFKQCNISITLNNIFQEYSENFKKNFDHFYSKEILNQKQLTTLNKKVINKYIYILKTHYNDELLDELFPYLRLKEENPIGFMDRREILNTIQKTLEKKDLIDISNYLIYSLVYIFSISITLHSHKSLISYIERLIKIISKIKFKLFTRQIVYILVKTFYKYYLIHKEKQIYPDLNCSNIKIYFYMLIEYVLKKNNIIPNEEMLIIFNNFFYKILFQERESLNQKEVIEDFEDKEIEVEDENNFRIEKGKNFLCFMKHCFTSKKVFKPNTMVKVAMKKNTDSNVIIKTGKSCLQPTINIKINEYFYSSYFFFPKKIYKLIKSTYNDFFDKGELDMSKLMIKNVRDIITNLILFGLELNNNGELIPFDFLVYTLYAFKDHEKKYGNNNIQEQKN